MKVLITGGRDFADYRLLAKVLDLLHEEHCFDVLIHGGARGADQLAGKWARSKGIDVEVFPANWKKYGRRAGFIRNSEMLNEDPQMLVAFPGGKGTANMVQLVRGRGNCIIHLV